MKYSFGYSVRPSALHVPGAGPGTLGSAKKYQQRLIYAPHLPLLPTWGEASDGASRRHLCTWILSSPRCYTCMARQSPPPVRWNTDENDEVESELDSGEDVILCLGLWNGSATAWCNSWVASLLQLARPVESRIGEGSAECGMGSEAPPMPHYSASSTFDSLLIFSCFFFSVFGLSSLVISPPTSIAAHIVVRRTTTT